MSSNAINKKSLLAGFDDLVSKEVLVYDDAQRIVPYSEGTFQALFFITSAFDEKPSVPSEGTATAKDDLMPGSDISIAGYEVCNIGTSHVLAYNMFSVFRPHLLLLTSDGHKRQHTPLDIDDIRAVSSVVRDVSEDGGSDWIGIFNCGKDGGCSRLHKHLQVFPLPEHERQKHTTFPDNGLETAKVPFKYFLHRFETTATAEEIFDVYVGLLSQAKQALGREGNMSCPHNMVLCKSWIVVIPRRAGNFDGLGVNAAGMMGLIAVNSEEEYQKWLSIGPEKVLAETGVAI